MARTSNNKVISSGDLYCCLLAQCDGLRTCRSGFSIATKWWCEGCARFSLHTKNVRSVQFVVKRRGCCCNHSAGIGLECAVQHKGNVHEEKHYIFVARTSNNRVISSGDLYCCLLPQCDALCTCHSGFPIATVAHTIIIHFN